MIKPLLFFALVVSQSVAQDTDQVNDSLLPTGRTITPAGKTISFYGRPVDMDIHKQILFVKNHKELKAIDVDSMDELAAAEITDGASLYGIAINQDGQVFVTSAKEHIHVFDYDKQNLTLIRSIKLPSDCFPCGLEFSSDFNTLYVCLSKKNSVAVVNVESGMVTDTISVGVAPFDCRISGNRLHVSNLGGRNVVASDATAPSAGTQSVVDDRGIASTGSVSVIDLVKKTVIHEVASGLHPSVIDGNEQFSIVCNSNEDSVSLIHAKQNTSKFVDVKPDNKLPFGSMPSCVRLLGNNYVLVTLAGNNALAVFEWSANDSLHLAGHVPTAWYPGAIAFNDKYLFVGSIKGIGARAVRRASEKGRNSHDHQGAIQRIEMNELSNGAKLKEWSQQVSTNSRLPQIVRNQLLEKPSSDMAAEPIPKKLGHPSLFKHVIYVIKENRTFDQIFGDYEQARSDKNLCIFPREKTPNHHALADRFGLLDNYYCNGVLSADGHSWATEGNVTPYLERAFGGFSRSYTFGNDPLTYSSSGFIWDHILSAGLSFRNYGEFNYAKIPDDMGYHEIFKKYSSGEHIEFGHNIGIERLRKYSCLDYPGWNMEIPDVLRMDRFLKEFQEFKTNDSLPNFCILYLPEDHLGAENVTSNAHMADNDLALGRLVEAVSNSKFWQDTVIFVNEDDPQNGFDHIDGHRSLCLVVSPYSKKGINHQFYNQTSVLRTMLHIFGLPPMNQQDASAPLMTDCFTNKADLAPYKAITPKTKLDEAPKVSTLWSDSEKKWRNILATVPIKRTGMKTEKDEDNFNRFIWHETKGWNKPYPEKFTGAHATGLRELGLSINPSNE